MCRHCDRIKDDVESKPIVHAFAADAALKMTRLHGIELAADDIDILLEVTDPEKRRAITERALSSGPSVPTEWSMRMAIAGHRILAQAARAGEGLL